jgi:(E)-4-hydroxy-3-methylbut-2-enyl-diphosphate synthase
VASQHRITVGGVPIGGGAPVVVQSMTTTDTHDVEATLAQIGRLAEAGCEIVRVAVPGRADADALPRVVAGSPIPVIADIHFNASLALRAIDAGVAAVRINPGNIGGDDRVEAVVRAAARTGTPMRIGANSGSLPDHLRQYATNDPAGALVQAAIEEVELLERLGFRDFKISVKSTSVPVMIDAYRRLAERVPYPLHLGVTEAGTLFTGTVKSAIGIGSLLVAGVGDTLRVSLAADPVQEVTAGWEILRALGLRHRGPTMIACPSCGRTNVDVLDLAEAVEARLAGYDEVFEVAVMGCAVNGPGEAGDADFGIAGGRDAGFIYAHGEVLRKVPQALLVDELFREIDGWIAAGMARPDRRTRKLGLADAPHLPVVAGARAR